MKRVEIASYILIGMLLLGGLSLPPAALAEEPPRIVEEGDSASQGAKPELVFEFDAYYTDVGLHLPLTGEPIPDLGEAEELSVYKRLFLNSLTPRYMLLEAAVFPMPVLGVYLKKNHGSFYRSAGSGDFNIIESITAGFQEPYAFSVFFGDMANFVRPGEERKETNKGYMGYMLSYSDQHIKNNSLINDSSYEAEWKLKGDRVFRDEKLSWSFRLGTKIHEHPHITNVAYLGMRRSNLDFNSAFLSWIKNSSFELKWDFSLRDGNLVRQEYVVGKKYPFQRPHFALRLDLGLIWESNRKYTGPLRDQDFHNYLLVFRPNLQF